MVDKNRPMVTHLWMVEMLGGDHAAALLLNQMVYWYLQMKQKPFYKYIEPPSGEHDGAYRTGDSWTEEMGMTKKQFTRARDLIAIKTKSPKGLLTVKVDKHGQLLSANRIVVYWQINNNRTKYAVNMVLLYAYQAFHLGKSSAIGNVDIQGLTLEFGMSAKMRHDQKALPMLPKGTSDVTKRSHPIAESTQKITQKKKEAALDKPLFQAIAECHFNVSGGMKISKAKSDEIKAIYDLLKPKGITTHQVYAVKTWWNGKGYKFFPKKLADLEQVYLDFVAQKTPLVRESEDREAQVAAERDERRRDMIIK